MTLSEQEMKQARLKVFEVLERAQADPTYYLRVKGDPLSALREAGVP